MIKQIGIITGYAGSRMNRARRLITLASASFVILLISTIMTGWLVQHEIATIYTANYNALTSAGITDLITAPQVVSDHILLLLTIFPLIGAGFVLPILLLACIEVYRMSCDKDHETILGSDKFVNKYIAGHIDIS